MTSPAPWKSWDNTVKRTMYNSESNLSWYKGYWPKGSYSGHERLEPGRFPGVDNPPFLNSNTPESGLVPCGPANPCPWGGANNEGIVVMQNGVPTRRGMCVRGRCDCPIGQTGRHCSGLAHKDAFGEVAWSNSQLGVPTYDPYDFTVDRW